MVKADLLDLHNTHHGRSIRLEWCDFWTRALWLVQAHVRGTGFAEYETIWIAI